MAIVDFCKFKAIFRLGTLTLRLAEEKEDLCTADAYGISTFVPFTVQFYRAVAFTVVDSHLKGGTSVSSRHRC